jgi:hypothetical protein
VQHADSRLIQAIDSGATRPLAYRLLRTALSVLTGNFMPLALLCDETQHSVRTPHMIAAPTVSFSSAPVCVPPEAFALRDYAQVSSGAGPLFPFLMPGDVSSEVEL